MVLVCTWARNAEQILPRAVDSILAQTYTEWTYFLIDNASTDGTLSLMRDYAARDARIHAIANTENDMQTLLTYLPQWLDTYAPDDCFIQLDADDEYTPDCFEVLLELLGRTGADMACCNSLHVREHESHPDERGITREMVVTAADWGTMLPEWYNYARTMWGKLSKLSLLRKCNFRRTPHLVYGADTLLAMEIFSQCDTLAVTPQCLHRYYIYESSISYRFDATRVESDRILYRRGCMLVRDKAGTISKPNKWYLGFVYFLAVRETMRVLMRSGLPCAAKARFALRVFQNPRFGIMFLRQGIGRLWYKLYNH